MAYTEQTWEYLGLLNECIRIILTTLLGVLLAYFGVFDSHTFVPHAVKFVFHVALPLHILRGIGIVVDFYSPKFRWNYIEAFLILRAIALVVSFTWVFVTSRRGPEKKGIGEVAILWLVLTWISTVILGVPISTSVFNSEALGMFYGLLAGISSFIFQLPLQLLFLECHVLEQQYLADERQRTTPPLDLEAPEEGEDTCSNASDGPSTTRLKSGEQEGAPAAGQATGEIPTKANNGALETTAPVEPLFLWLQFARRRDIWKKIILQVLKNPVIWGIAGGFILSLSTIGPRFLNPTSSEYVPGLGWFYTTTEWFGNMVSPLSLFAMGVWLQNQGKKIMRISIIAAALSMLSKLVLVPLLMVGLAFAMGLSDVDGRAAVLIAALPISMASFSLGSHYKIGEALLSENVALGTALMLPTILLWNLVMDAIGLFPINT